MIPVVDQISDICVISILKGAIELKKAMENLNNETIFLMGGEKISALDFCENFTGLELEESKDVIEMYLRKNIMTVYDGKTKQEAKVSKAFDQEKVKKQAEVIESQEQARKDKMAEDKRQDRLLYDEIEIPFADYRTAKEMQNYCRESLRIQDVEVIDKDDEVIVVCKNISDSELNKINLKYNAEKVMAKTQHIADKAVMNTAGAINYTAEKLITPVATIGAKGAMSLLKTATKTVLSTGASCVTQISKGIKETKYALDNDPEMIKAKSEIFDAKDNAIRGLKSLRNSNPSGIRIK